MWFQKKKSAPLPSRSSPAAPAVTSATSSGSSHEQTVRLLEQRLRRLEEQLSDLAAKHPRIHIDNLHVHQPVLENLTFRLDQLDIKELSGSLNLGNNFGAKPNAGVHPESGAKAFQRTPEAKPVDSNNRSAGVSPATPPAETGHERTSTGYRYSPSQSKA